MKRSDLLSIYANIKQQLFLYQVHEVKFLHAGRGTGKSHCIGFSAYEKIRLLPRSLGLMTCKTILQFKEKTYPVMSEAWQSIGLIEGVDYVAFKRRPEHFEKPFREPKDFENVIWFINGTGIQVVGSKQYDSARGGSYDWVEGDEIGFFPESFWEDVILPSLRGNVGKYVTTISDLANATGRTSDFIMKIHKARRNRVIMHPLHYQVCLYTSPPRKVENMWIYKFRDLAKTNPKRFYWLEANALDNIAAFTKKRLKMLQLMMSKRSYNIEILGNEQSKAELLYYFAYNEIQTNYKPTGTAATKQLHFDRAIDLSFDFSGWFNGLIALQSDGLKEYLFDCMHVKIESSFLGLVDMFCSKYDSHQCKIVRVYGEPRGHDRRPEGSTLYQQIESRFVMNGWRVVVLTPKSKRTEEHIDRHKILNEIFQESNPLFPILKINEVDAYDVTKALAMTEVLPDYTKQKKMEKNRDFPQEHAPHFTDMIDYYFYQKHGYRFAQTKGNTLEYMVR